MDERQTTHSLSPSEAEEFWTGGNDARPSEAAEAATRHPLSESVPDATGDSMAGSVGIDVPGVGCVPLDEVSPGRSGREVVAGQVTPIRNLSGDDFVSEAGKEIAELMARLLFAAGDLAAAQIVGPLRFYCRECLQDEASDVLLHEIHCKTGRVLTIISELCALSVAVREAKAQQGGAQ